MKFSPNLLGPVNMNSPIDFKRHQKVRLFISLAISLIHSLVSTASSLQNQFVSAVIPLDIELISASVLSFIISKAPLILPSAEWQLFPIGRNV